MIHGYIFDVYIDYRNDSIVTWLKTRKKSVAVKQSYHPSFFVSASRSDLNILARKLAHHPQVQLIQFKKKKTILGSEKQKQVLEITPATLSSFHQLTKQVDMWGKYHIYQLYNVDLRLPTQYLQYHGLFFNAYVSWNRSSFILNDSQWAIDYSMPAFSTCVFSIQQRKQGQITSPDDSISAIIIDDVLFQEENEIDTILSALRFFHHKDPDIIYTKKGDSIIFPFLFNRAKKLGILKHLNLGRDSNGSFYPFKKEASYMSYGQIIHRPAFYILRGRVHIDTVHSFFHTEGRLYGLIDLSRCSNISFQLLSRVGPGTAISQIQMNHAIKQGYLIPFKKTQPEMWKTAANLLVSDRGGLILSPVVGLHEDVIELDFASLYPNIIVDYNISPETLLCSCCSLSHQRVPQLGYYVCTKKQGLLPVVLKPILERRFLFKARSKNPGYDMERYAQLQKTWKWILIVCFGYTGYRNARYGRIECHESITAYSRDILIKAIQLVEKAGYKVLHGIVDSLWICPDEPLMKPVHLARVIGKKTGVRIELKGRYHWIVFLPSKETGVGALNRYYGLFDDGILKMRGIELRQHNTPLFFKNVQQSMLRVFQEATNTWVFQQQIPYAIEVLFDAAYCLCKHDVNLDDLVFTTRISKVISSYKVDTFAKAALKQLQQFNIYLKPGQIVQYLVCDHHSSDSVNRVCVKELITEQTSFDVRFYLRYLAQCGETLLFPFEYTAEMLENMMLKKVGLRV